MIPDQFYWILMKREIRIRPLDLNVDSLQKLVIFHRNLFEELPFSKYLIYFDENFDDYLFKTISTNDNAFYVIYHREILSGFIHFKLMNDRIFLNNFYTEKSIRGGGIGKLFLKECLSSFVNQLDFIELDVFDSNRKVVEWYSRIGLKITYTKNWYFYRIKAISNNVNFEIKADSNGFLGINSNNKKVATVINDNLFLHDIDGINSFINENQNLLSNLELESTKDFLILEKKLLDKSFRMLGEISSVFENL